MLTNYGEDYFKRLSQNKDVFIYADLDTQNNDITCTDLYVWDGFGYHPLFDFENMLLIHLRYKISPLIIFKRHFMSFCSPIFAVLI
jgi:hypothetical protein